VLFFQEKECNEHYHKEIYEKIHSAASQAGKEKLQAVQVNDRGKDSLYKTAHGNVFE
jgi:hypothetical protein